MTVGSFGGKGVRAHGDRAQPLRPRSSPPILARLVAALVVS